MWPFRDKGPIAKRARRIKAVRSAEKSMLFNNHLGASYDFQMVDVLRDIRGLLLIIALILAAWYLNKPETKTYNVTIEASDIEWI